MTDACRCKNPVMTGEGRAARSRSEHAGSRAVHWVFYLWLFEAYLPMLVTVRA